MKKRLAVLITLAVMILACTASVAAADTRVSLHNDLTYDAGRLRIAWDVTGDEAGPYTVTVKVFNNGTASQILTEVGTTSGHFILGREGETDRRSLPGRGRKACGRGGRIRLREAGIRRKGKHDPGVVFRRGRRAGALRAEQVRRAGEGL